MIDEEFEELEKMLRKLYNINLYGFSHIVRPDGTEEVRTFGNFAPEGVIPAEPHGEEDSDRENLVDVIVDKKKGELVVTAEMPGFERDDIKLKTAEKRIEIRAKKDGMTYHKTLPLEVEIEPKSIEVKLNNGVLEIKSTLKKGLKR